MSADVTILERELRALMPDLLGYFVRRLTDSEDAADALSETLVVLWRKQRSLPAGEDLRRYAFGVARKVLQTAQRGRLRRREISDALHLELVDAVVTPPDDVDLQRALAAIPAQDRELVLLVAWEGFGVAEAGAVLGLRADAARARYSRARARLRALLVSDDVEVLG